MLRISSSGERLQFGIGRRPGHLFGGGQFALGAEQRPRYLDSIGRTSSLELPWGKT